MKILLIHSYYRQRGGEDVVFEQEFELLSQSQETKAIIFQNVSGWRGAAQFFFSIWNPYAARKLRKQISRFRPDLVHVYNWHYATGPIIVRTAYDMGIPVVMSVGNYRLLCPSGTLVHKGKIYLESLMTRGFPWKAVFRKVYRNSYVQSFWLALVVWTHDKLGTWGKPAFYIVPTYKVKSFFTDYRNYLDIPAEKIIVKPNFSVQTGELHVNRDEHFLFIGRLSEEKGIDVLLDAFKASSHELHIAGEGPLLGHVMKACSLHSNIKYVGKLDGQAVKEEMSRCSAFVFPSICYETFGMVLTEAFANGCPVIATDIGSPVEIVKDGVTGMHFKAGDKESLRSCLDRWQGLSSTEKERYHDNCLSDYAERFSPGKNKDLLMAIYHSAIRTNPGSA